MLVKLTVQSVTVYNYLPTELDRAREELSSVADNGLVNLVHIAAARN